MRTFPPKASQTVRVTEKPSVPLYAAKLFLHARGNEMSGKRSAEYLAKLQNREYPEPASPPRRIRKSFDIRQSTTAQHRVYTLTPRAGDIDCIIIYAHGGAYAENLLSLHWTIIRQLAERMGAKIIIPIYPLAPEHDFRQAYAFLDTVYDAVLAEAEKPVFFSGDSAGGGISLVQAARIVKSGKTGPAGLILFSPWVDISMGNPDAQAIEPEDPLLGVQSLREMGNWWAAGEHPKHPALSPVYGDLRNLPPAYIFQGTSDILLPDVRVLADRIEQERGIVYMYEYTGAFHVFMMMPHIPETEHVFSQLEILRGTIRDRGK